MNREPDILGEAGLKFFGRMSASISHELKNVLAIIKENSGLLGDYIGMMAESRPVAPERFLKVARRIEAQTGRADTIIKDLNLFAHTVDSATRPVDLNQSLALLVALHQRPAAMERVTLEPSPADMNVTITTSPFMLLNALSLVLMYAIKSVPSGETMTIAAFQSESETGICFDRLKNLSHRPVDAFPEGIEKVLLDALGARAKIERTQGRIVVALPRE